MRWQVTLFRIVGSKRLLRSILRQAGVDEAMRIHFWLRPPWIDFMIVALVLPAFFLEIDWPALIAVTLCVVVVWSQVSVEPCWTEEPSHVSIRMSRRAGGARFLERQRRLSTATTHVSDFENERAVGRTANLGTVGQCVLLEATSAPHPAGGRRSSIVGLGRRRHRRRVSVEGLRARAVQG